jgi:hypothetical protein
MAALPSAMRCHCSQGSADMCAMTCRCVGILSARAKRRESRHEHPPSSKRLPNCLVGMTKSDQG